MNKKNKNWIIIGIIAVLIIIAIATAVWAIFNNNKNLDLDNKSAKVTINIFDKENSNIYNKSLKTDKEDLLGVLEDIKELKVITEDSQYGAFIISILGIEQGDNYYWSYYINGEYASVGVSNCKVENGKTYDFKIEKFQE